MRTLIACLLLLVAYPAFAVTLNTTTGVGSITQGEILTLLQNPGTKPPYAQEVRAMEWGYQHIDSYLVTTQMTTGNGIVRHTYRCDVQTYRGVRGSITATGVDFVGFTPGPARVAGRMPVVGEPNIVSVVFIGSEDGLNIHGKLYGAAYKVLP